MQRKDASKARMADAMAAKAEEAKAEATKLNARFPCLVLEEKTRMAVEHQVSKSTKRRLGRKATRVEREAAVLRCAVLCEVPVYLSI